MHPLPPKYSVAMALIHAPAGDALDRIFIRCFRLSCREATYPYVNDDTITLPNLRRFGFRGDSMFIDVLVRRISTPRLEKLDLDFFN
jgi:hypothetical protein